MKNSDIINYRLFNQQIAETTFSKPEEIVSWMIAMQAQEFAMAKWAIGLRLPKCSDAIIDKAFNEGAILRTHLMRPTWHFVTPSDIRWILALTAPRVQAVNSFMYRKLNFDKSILKRSNDTLAKALQGGKHLTRIELQAALLKETIKADGIPLSLLMMCAELDGIICSGARKGKQFTYALLDEIVPGVKPFHREEVLAKFTRRYFESRGPATLKDFVTWSGLTMKDARDGALKLSSEFIHKNINGQDYIFKKTALTTKNKLQRTFLLPDYDEYGMSYKDRSALFLPANKPEMNKGGNGAYQHMIVINGTIGGTWKRTIKNNKIDIETTSFEALNKTDQQAVEKAVKKYSLFIGKGLDDK